MLEIIAKKFTEDGTLTTEDDASTLMYHLRQNFGYNYLIRVKLS